MKSLKITLFILLLFTFKGQAQKYKDMMEDYSINFYDVVKEAESYFKTINKDVKGSGYKNFMRWHSSNEYKYYPSGDRASVDHGFPERAYQKYLLNNKKNAKTTKLFGNWRELGPLAIGKITNNYTVGIGRIIDFHVNPDNTDVIYIGSRSGGLWKTTNGGDTWQSTGTEKLPATGVGSIAVDPTNFAHVYITCQNAINNYSYGIYESFDGGVTFNQARFNPENLGLGGLGSNFEIFDLKIHPTIDNLIFVGTSAGLYKTTNNFNSWTLIINSGSINQIETHPANVNIVYVYNLLEKNKIYRSIDRGDSFSTISINNNNNKEAIIATTIDAQNDLYFASESGIFKSTDSGRSFTLVANSISSLETVGADAFAVNSNNSNNMIIGSVDAANSLDGGLNFTQRTDWNLRQMANGSGSVQDNYFKSTAYVHADIRKAKSINGVFYAATDGCLAKSTDQGVTWSNLTKINTPGIRENYKLGLSQSDNDIVICGSQDNGTTIKNDNEWVEAHGADGMEGIVLPINPNYMIGSIQFGKRIRTLDRGENNTLVITNDVNGWWEAPLAYNPNDHFNIYDFRNGVYTSNDFGLNYTYVGAPQFLKANPDSYWDQIRNAEIAQNNPNIIIVSGKSEIEKSTNGETFVSIKNNLPNSEIEDIAINPNNDNDIFVVYASYQNDNKKVYRSENGGSSWYNISYNLGNIPTHTIVIDQTDNPYIYIGTEIGVYYKPLNGNTWVLYNNGLPNIAIEELEINHGANTIKAATWGRGLWEYDLVNRSTYPTIEKTSITNPPSFVDPKENTNQIVTSTINYEGQLSKVEVRYSVNDLLFNNSISMTNTTGNTWVADSSLPTSITGDKVYFKVFATGSYEDTSSTYKFMYEVRIKKYCEASGKSGTGGDYITQVKVGDFINNSGKNNYSLYNNLDTISFSKGNTYEVAVSLNIAFDLDNAAIWVDFNGDATFDDNELINMSKYENNTAKGTIVLPDNTLLNTNLRMRVSNIYNSDISPCGTAFGEVEDYIINVSDGTLSVNNFIENDRVTTVYPNPSKNYVYVKSDKMINKIEVFDLKGRKVIYKTNVNKLNTDVIVKYLDKSIYLLYVHTNDGIIVKKIIKD